MGRGYITLNMYFRLASILGIKINPNNCSIVKPALKGIYVEQITVYKRAVSYLSFMNSEYIVNLYIKVNWS